MFQKLHMKIDNRQIIETVGLSAVVLSLLFVALEIRQSNRIAVVNAEYELRNNFSSINEAILTQPDLADFLLKISIEGEVLEGADAIRARMWTSRLMNIWLAAALAYENGFATQATYDNIFDNIRFGMNRASPEMRVIWRESVASFPSLSDTSVFRHITEMLDQAESAGQRDG